MWNMRVTVKPNIVGARGTVPKGCDRELEQSKIGERINIIQTKTLLR